MRTSITYPQCNGKIERYHATISRECLRKQSFLTLEDAPRQATGSVDYYITKRLHSALYYLTPEEVLNGKMKQRVQEREEQPRTAAGNCREVNRAA